MARIRSTHPGQWTDDQFVTCSPLARLLAIGVRNEADDNGIFEWNPVKLKMRLLPADNCDVAVLLDELLSSEQVWRFEVGGKPYGLIRNFHEYQSPKYPAFHFPSPPGALPNGYRLNKKYQSKTPEVVPQSRAKSKAGSPSPPPVLPQSSPSPPEKDGDKLAPFPPGEERRGEDRRTPPYSPPPKAGGGVSAEGKSGPDPPSPKSRRKRRGEMHYPAEFETAMACYPRRAGHNPKRAAFAAWSATTESGADPPDVENGVLRYARFCRITGKIDTEKVMHASTFFGAEEHWRLPWNAPAAAANGGSLNGARRTSSGGIAPSYADARPGETMDDYQARKRREADRRAGGAERPGVSPR